LDNTGGSGLAKVYALRKITTFPSGKSLSYVVQDDRACPGGSYRSFETLRNDRKKHWRPQMGPKDRYEREKPPLTSHEIGWFGDEKPLRKPIYPISSSAMTKFFDSMAQMSHMKKR